jgi:hypothetical protein
VQVGVDDITNAGQSQTVTETVSWTGKKKAGEEVGVRNQIAHRGRDTDLERFLMKGHKGFTRPDRGGLFL